MIALDTNVLIRHLYQLDDPAQTQLANRVVADAIAAGHRIFVSLAVLAETTLVLRNIYGLNRQALVQVIEALSRDQAFEIERRTLVRSALVLFGRGPADFNDYLIGQLAHDAGSRTTYTFDKKLKRARDFTWLRAP